MDYSFLKLYKNDFQAAILNENSRAYETIYSGFVQMLPDEWFVQITNTSDGIAFGGNLSATLIDECGNLLYTFTVGTDLYLLEFKDQNGIDQIAYEFGNIGLDFDETNVYLKLKHTVSDSVWYSAAFQITEYLSEQTTRFEYKNEFYYRGIDYGAANFYQSIRLKCFKTDIDFDIESEEYIQMTGNKVSLRSIITPKDKYKFYTCDLFTYNRLITLLNHNIIFIEGYKTTDKPKATKEDRIEMTNIFGADFEFTPSEDYKAFEFQIKPATPIPLLPDFLPGDWNMFDFQTTV